MEFPVRALLRVSAVAASDQARRVTRTVRFATSALFVLVLSAIPASSAFGAQDDAWVAKEQRSSAPKLMFSDIPGARRQLSQLKGKVIVVNFWATWCVPCKTEMPEFTKAHAAYRARGVEFVGAANEPRSAKNK